MRCLKRLEKNSRKQANKDPRRIKFAQAYLETGNALQSAIAAGYSESYGRTRGHVLAAMVNVTLAKVAQAKGLNQHRLIGKYESFLDAKEPKWNSDSKDWDLFENSKVQLEATRDLCEIIEPRQSQTSFGAAIGHGKDGRPTLNVFLKHTVGRPDRQQQQVKTLSATQQVVDLTEQSSEKVLLSDKSKPIN